MTTPWDLLTRIWRLQRRMVQEALPCLEAAGLSPKAFFLLAAIQDTPCPSGLSRNLKLPPPTVSHFLKRLEAEGYVERTPDPEDLRRYRLHLTPKGHEALQAGRACLERALARRMKGVSPEDLENLERILTQLEEA